MLIRQFISNVDNGILEKDQIFEEMINNLGTFIPIHMNSYLDVGIQPSDKWFDKEYLSWLPSIEPKDSKFYNEIKNILAIHVQEKIDYIKYLKESLEKTENELNIAQYEYFKITGGTVW